MFLFTAAAHFNRMRAERHERQDHLLRDLNEHCPEGGELRRPDS